MRDSLAARAMVAMINGETDAPAVAEAEAAERAAESSAETCVDGADYAADRAERAERAVLDTARMDVDGAWTAVAEAESAARDAEVCAGLIGAERATYADRARAAVNRAKDAAERARGVAEDRQLAADDERCGLASVDDARAAANDARDSVATAERWAHGCPVVGGFPAELAGWVEDARAAAAEAIRAAGRAREAAAGRGAELRSWGRVEWFTIAGACADDARDAAKRAAEAARLAAGARGRADRAAGEAESAADGGAGEGAPLKVPALPQGLDANASMEAGAPGGEGVESRKLDANASSKVGSPATDDDGGDGAPGAGSAAPRPDRGPAGGPVAGGATPDPDGSEVAPEVKHARRRAEEADLRAAEARHRAEQLGDSAAAHYGRFAGGQPILMGHRSAAGALRDRARGDAATRRAIEARTAADRAESAARKARAEAELAETVHGRSRPWERGDFQRGDVVEVRKIYTDTYVVVRANAKTLTLRNMNTIDDTKARYDQVLSRRRDGQTLTDPGADSTSEEGLPAPAEEPPADGGGDVPGWAPALDGERWDYAAVRRVLVRGGLAEGELGERDGWHVGPDMWDVMITRVQGSHYFRPRGESARRSWDDALDAYRAAVEAAGMTVVRRNAHCVVVRVPVPAELRVTARARRTADLSDFTTVVEFEGFGDIGGTVTLRSAGVGASWYEVRDHTGRTIPDAGRDRRAATASLAYSYGLPTPAEYIEEGPAPAAPTTAEEPPRPAVADETGPAPQRAEDELRALVHDADRPAVPEPSAAAVPPPAEPGPEADGGPAPAAGPRPGPTPGGAPAAAGAPRPAAGAPCRRAPVARGSAAGVRGYPRRSQRTTGGHATTPTTTSATTPGGGTGVRAPGGRGPPRPPGRAPVREGALPWNLTGMRQVRRVVHPREGPLPRLPTPCQSPMPRCRHDRPRPDHRGRAPPPRPSDPRRDDPLSPHPHRHRQRP
ncbi:DUF3560 domain-containing protein [Streptomyces jumonjinensis]|uniref:DUF3560 domain-containing protein n=1 Tax=Streptomyces jumonjinensis TaxID=1945 RepID=UPI0037A1B973